VGAELSEPGETGRGVHPASCTVGTGPFLGLKLPGCGVDHAPLSNSGVKERVELFLCPPLPHWGFVTCSRMNFLGGTGFLGSL